MSTTTERALQDNRRIIADLRTVTDRAGTRLTRELYEQHREDGMYSVAEVVRRAGSWTAAITALDAGPSIIPATGIACRRPRVSDKEALAHVRHVADRLGVRHLTQRDYDQHRDPGTLTQQSLRLRFGSWANIHELAGLGRELTRKTSVTDDEALAHVREVAERAGDLRLSQLTYDQHRDADALTQQGLRLRFGSWKKVRQAAGLNREQGRPTATVLEDLRVAARAAGTFPALSVSDYGEHSRPHSIGYDGLRRRFGSWGAVCEKAGLTTTSRVLDPDLPSEEDTMEALREVAAELGTPFLSEFAYEQGRGQRPSAARVVKLFGSWSEASRRAGLESARTGGKTSRPTEKILEDLRDVADRLGTTSLSKEDYDSHRGPGALTGNSLVRRFPSWADLLSQAGLSTSHRQVTRQDVTSAIASTARILGTTGLGSCTYEAHRDPRAPSRKVILGVFGTWAAACEAAGVSPVAVPVSGDEGERSRVAAQVRSVADDLGVTTLTSRAYNAARTDGMLPATTVRRRFGTWAAACEAAGLVPAAQGHPTATEEDVIAGLMEVAAGLGTTTLSISIYDSARDPDRHLTAGGVITRLGSWLEACRAAALTPGVQTGGGATRPAQTDRELLAGLRQVADDLSVVTLTKTAYDEARDPDRHVSSASLANRFGTWAAACQAARLSSGKSRRRTFGAWSHEAQV